MIDCKFIKYKIQVNSYQAIIHRNFARMQIRELYLVLCHPQQKKGYAIKAIATDIPRMSMLIEYYLENNQLLTQIKNQVILDNNTITDEYINNDEQYIDNK